MIPVNDLFLTEGVWSFVKNSIANLFGGDTVKVKKNTVTDKEQILRSEAVHRRLTPKPLAVTREKLGFKQIKR